ncbi:hypothetical protein SFRURICE_003172, partial [Spodoptera frugiperda]
MGGVASDSGESDCSLMSSVSQMSTASVTARARKRTRTTARSAQDAVEILPASDKDALERLAKENTELRSQVASLKEAVAGLKNQLNLLSQQGATQKTQVSGLPEPADWHYDGREASCIRKKINWLRLLPEKPVRPALASDARRLVASKPVQTEVTAKKAKKKKKKKTKTNAVTPIVAAASPVIVSTSAAMDVQPGTANSQDNTTWSLVVGRKAKKANTSQPVASSASTVQVKKSSKPSVKLPKVPASAAITVRVREGATVGLGEVLAEARRRINLSEFGITSDSCREKRAADGGIVLMISVLEPRRMMCYRCFEPGHVRRMCTSSVDRSSQCYVCGGAHKARECTSPTPKCPVCSDQGRPANHRLGGKQCNPQKKRSQKKLQE